MKRALWVGGLAFLGAVLGSIVANRLSLLVTACGEDCAAPVLTTYVVWVASGAILFAGAAAYWARRGEVSCWPHRVVGLVAIFLLAGGAIYVRQLEQKNEYLYSIREIQPTNDFSQIVIARQAIRVFADAAGDTAQVFYEIAPWERCALGYAHEDKQPVRIEIECRKGIGWITQDEEKHLFRVGSER